jgi:hypothetical protein
MEPPDLDATLPRWVTACVTTAHLPIDDSVLVEFL